jgi:hypothetical protein
LPGSFHSFQRLAVASGLRERLTWIKAASYCYGKMRSSRRLSDGVKIDCFPLDNAHHDR